MKSLGRKRLVPAPRVSEGRGGRFVPTASANKVPEREAALLVGSAGSLAEDDEQQQSGLLGTGQRDRSAGPAGKRLRVQTLLEESQDAGRG